MSVELWELPDIENVLAPDRVAHLYPNKPPYTNAPGPRAKLGDIAYCGHIKDTMHDPASLGWPLCDQCNNLDALGL